MSVINTQPLIGASGQGGDYLINNSLRFRSGSSAYLSRTPASAGNRQTFTLAAWVKRGVVSSGNPGIFGTYNGSGAFQVYFAGDNLGIWSGNASVSVYTNAVYRDPSAWYHIVLAVDTTQATASNRVKLYVNGSQVTSFSTASYPAQNANIEWNQSGQLAVIGALQNNSTGSVYLHNDCYMTEIHAVDGQALDPTSFGSFDTVTGVWKPKKYAGTYGTNGFYLPFSASSSSSYAASFNGSNQYVYLGGQSNFAFGTGDFTVEMWINPNSTSSGILYDSRPYTTNGNYPCLYFDTGNLYYYINGNNQITVSNIKTGVWQHVALVRSSGVIKVYVNGVQSGGSYTDSSDYLIGASRPVIGVSAYNVSTGYYNGYMSNLRVLKGTALYTASFTPPSAALTAITNTQLLTFQSSTLVDNSANAFTINNNNSVATTVQYPFTVNLARDASGNGNNWTTNNISLVTGSTYDSMTDVPTLTSATASNYCVLNPLNSYNSSSVVNGNMQFNNTNAQYESSIGTMFVSSGKWYAEATVVVQNITGLCGIADPSWNAIGNTSILGYSAKTYTYKGNSVKINNSVETGYGGGVGYWGTGDVIGMALDMDNGTLEFFKNGTSAGTAFTGLTGLFTFAVGGYNTNMELNCGQRPFKYTPPTGFKTLNTYNLPTPAIKAGNKVMDATTYTGNGGTQSIVNASGFKPDFVWVKNRTLAYGHGITDSVRGTTKILCTNNTNTEYTYSDELTAFNANGFSLGASSGGFANVSGSNYVAWQFQAGQGTTSTNTSGSITSTVSVNASAGFSVVTWTGNGVQTATVGHGLGVTPSFILIKRRDVSQDWGVYHVSNGKKLLQLNTNSALWNSASDYWYALPTSTVFSPDNSFTDHYQNVNGGQYVAYCWSEVAGFSKFGIFTGNGSTDNAFIYTGFRPKFVLIKATTGTDNWFILDSSRNLYNITNNFLMPNLGNAEGQDNFFDFLSNGFKMRLAGNTPYIYMAFAENPFKYSLAR